MNIIILDMSLNIEYRKHIEYWIRKIKFNGNKSLFARRKESEFAYCDLRAVIDWLLVPIRTRSWNAFTRSYVYFIYIFSSYICSSVHTTFVVITFKYPLLFLHRDRILSLLFYLYQYRYCSSLSLSLPRNSRIMKQR